ncbi:hypothetical protein CW752_10120 [Chryseobacterium sp. PMSZPI]|nr:hypothetical protein CW752_10120 [Chryseobacterium sp. PMSZPI]
MKIYDFLITKEFEILYLDSYRNDKKQLALFNNVIHTNIVIPIGTQTDLFKIIYCSIFHKYYYQKYTFPSTGGVAKIQRIFDGVVVRE